MYELQMQAKGKLTYSAEAAVAADLPGWGVSKS